MGSLSVNLCGIELDNPVIPASGTFGYGYAFAELYDINCLGTFSFKGTTKEPRFGNPTPRIAECTSGMINAVGLQNPGVEAFTSIYLPWLKDQGTAAIANIAGSRIEDYCAMAEKLNDTPVDMIEMNISCPNVKEGGVGFGTSCQSAAEVTAAVRKYCRKPLMVKLTPNVTNIGDIAAAVEDAGADALSLINTLTGMRIDIRTRRPILHNNTGGLSGPALLPVAVRMVRDVYKRVSIPVMGMGGISTWEDAVEMMIAGAAAIQVGAANFRDPMAMVNIIDGLEAYAKKEKLASISELTGTCTAQSGTIWYDSCLPQIENTNLLAPADSAPAMIMQLQTGAVDYVCTDMPTALAAVAKDDNLVILNFSGTDGDFQFATEEERAENVNIGISVQKGNTQLADAIDTVLSVLNEEQFNALMDQAISIQPEI